MSNATILFCEDDDLLLKLLSKVLTREGYDVIGAASAQRALTLADELNTPVDLLLSDITMPGIDGPTLAENLTDRWPDLPVLFISSFCREALLDRGLINDDTPLLEKPFHPAVLIDRIRVMLKLKVSLMNLRTTIPPPCAAPFSASPREQ